MKRVWNNNFPTLFCHRRSFFVPSASNLYQLDTTEGESNDWGQVAILPTSEILNWPPPLLEEALHSYQTHWSISIVCQLYLHVHVTLRVYLICCCQPRETTKSRPQKFQTQIPPRDFRLFSSTTPPPKQTVIRWFSHPGSSCFSYRINILIVLERLCNAHRCTTHTQLKWMKCKSYVVGVSLTLSLWYQWLHVA